MYHFGLKVGESDEELREARQRLTEAGVRVVGASDHTVTHSLYIEDPDGNQIELYIDVQPEVGATIPALSSRQSSRSSSRPPPPPVPAVVRPEQASRSP